jgi:urease accessory protein
MTTDTLTGTSLLRLLAWMSPAFPTGGFAYSHGLEWAVQAGEVRDADTLLLWLSDILHHGSAANDAILLRHAHHAAGDPGALRDLGELALALASSRERREETLNQGLAFGLAVGVWRDPIAAAAYPVAVGSAAGAHGIGVEAAATAFLQAVMANLTSAAVRLVPLGQTAGLRVLAELEPEILATVARSRDATLDHIGGCAFRSDLAAMHHETQHTRLFRS